MATCDETSEDWSVSVVGAVGSVITYTVTLLVTVPPKPEQVSVYVSEAKNLPVLATPEVGNDPDHAPEALQMSTLVEDHVSVVPLVP